MSNAPIAADHFSRQPGHLYAAQSLDGEWIKVGFSTRLEDRLRAINREYGVGGRFSLINATPSVLRAEQQIHRCLRPFRQMMTAQGRELYPAVPSLKRAVSVLVPGPDRPVFELDDYLDFARWCRKAAKEPENRIPALAAMRAIAQWRNEQRVALAAAVTA